MNKKFLISLIIVAVIGSLMTFYASNMFFGDVSNFGAGFSKTTLFVSLTGMLFGAMFITASLFLVRFYLRPNSRKILCRNYLFIAMALAAFGIIFAVLGGVVNYRGNFVSYPFPGYLIIMIILHALVLCGAAFTLFKVVLKMPEDTEKFKVSVKHIFHTLG